MIRNMKFCFNILMQEPPKRSQWELFISSSISTSIWQSLKEVTHVLWVNSHAIIADLSMSLSHAAGCQKTTRAWYHVSKGPQGYGEICKVPSNSWDTKVWNLGALDMWGYVIRRTRKQRKRLRERFKDGRRSFAPFGSEQSPLDRDCKNRRTQRSHSSLISYLLQVFCFYSVLLTLLSVFPSKLPCSFALLTRKPAPSFPFHWNSAWPPESEITCRTPASSEPC